MVRANDIRQVERDALWHNDIRAEQMLGFQWIATADATFYVTIAQI